MVWFTKQFRSAAYICLSAGKPIDPLFTVQVHNTLEAFRQATALDDFYSYDDDDNDGYD